MRRDEHARVALAFLVACHGNGGDDSATGPVDAASVVVPDADPCRDPGPDLGLLSTFSCKPGGLVGLSLDGMWTFTGTFTDLISHDETPATGEVTLERAGCKLRIAFNWTITGDRSSYIDETTTLARFSWVTPEGAEHSAQGERLLCVDPADDSLVFEDAYQSYLGGGNRTGRYHGVLTR